MKSFFIILVVFLQLTFAKSFYLSNIPLPDAQIINLNLQSCDHQCLQDLLENGQVFSFLSNYKPDIADENLTNEYRMLKLTLNVKSATTFNQVSIALLFPKRVIGRYAISTTNSILAYLLNKKIDFKLELFDCQNETLPLIQDAVKSIEEKGYNFVIAPFTQTGVEKLSMVDSSLIFYIPTVNKNDIDTQKANFIFGGIDYKKQIEELLPFTNDKIAIFADQSSTGFKLSKFIEDSDKNIVYKKIIPQTQTRFKQILKGNYKLQNSSIFLNTPLVKTSLLASQFRFYKIKPFALFSTQVNYNPLLLNLTQYEDRKNMYIANSIEENDPYLVATNRLLFNDINFDWINYSTSIGIDYLYNLYFNQNSQRVFNEEIINNQVQYNVNIVKPTASSFKELKILK